LDTPISEERIERDRRRIDKCLADLPYRIFRSEDERCMFGGPLRSIGQAKDILRDVSTFELFQNITEGHDTGIRFLIKQGTRDTHVDRKDTEDVVDGLRKLGYHVELILQEGKAHAWDCDEPLDETTKLFLDGKD
jgi:hypothetical protein